ncbi:hypothetical protein ACIQV3_21360 [Streptomyces sp. NPDC099050]|uniref:hypothetical protein n=1 Tax=Streptomyces sp. NPDC099050 TaxID=3366100 RepID=UPI0037F7F312
MAALIGLFHVPFLASLEQIPLARAAAEWPAAVPVSAAAGAALAFQAVRMARRWYEHRSVLARTWASTGDAVSDGNLLVVRDGDPHAFALPAWRKRAARVVVTTGMLRTKQPENHGPLLAVGTGLVPQRVEALLRPVPVRPQSHRTRAAVAGLVAAVSVSALLGLTLAYWLHEYVEVTARALLAG